MYLLKDINDLYDQFSNNVAAPGNLDKKTKELIAVACSVLADCAPCLEWHYGQAVTAGANQDEISEALAIAMSVAAGSKRAKYSPVVEKLEHGD
ncbi:MAG: carboxymuconolactone decarboxylase family protein [Anaerolineaceae bacterium]